MPNSFDDLEKYNEGHTLECFHHLDIEVINAEIKALHHSTLLFFEKVEIKETLFSLVSKFAFQKDTASLKIGKLSNNSNQKNAVYKLPLDDSKEVECGFVENFCRLFDLRDRLRKMRAEVEEKEYTTKYTSLSGNHIFNATVYNKCSYFEKLFAPVIHELNEGDKRRGSRYVVMSIKAQINALKSIMNKAYITLMNVTIYKEVISKHISHSASQYVLVALTRAGMVHTNKYLWEMIVTRREFVRKQRLNAEKQKETDLQAKLTQMQKSTSTQLDDKVNDKVDQTVPRAVREILAENLIIPRLLKRRRGEIL